MMQTPNGITGPNAGGLRQFSIRTPLAARVGQFCRSPWKPMKPMFTVHMRECLVCVTLSRRDAFLGVAKANIFLTLVGVPFAWLAMLALEFAVMLPFGLAADKWKWELDCPVWRVLGFLFGVAWLAPAEGYSHWMVPAAVALLLVPCFYLSVVLEPRACTRTWTAVDPARIRRGAFAANLASYALLFALACGWVTVELVTKGSHIERFRTKPDSPAHAERASWFHLDGVNPAWLSRGVRHHEVIHRQVCACLGLGDGRLRRTRWFITRFDYDGRE